jgi:hypothetical protein
MAEAGTMKLASNCHICARPAFTNCILCGQVTCKDHLDERGLACNKCAPGARKKRVSTGPGEIGGVS